MTVTYRQLVENGQKGDKQVVSEVPTVEADAEDHRHTAPTPTRSGTSSRSASRAAAGTPSTAVPTATTAASASTGARGGRSAAPSSPPTPASPPASSRSSWACGSTRSSAGTRGDVRTTCSTGRNGACDPVATHGDRRTADLVVSTSHGSAHSGDGARAARRARAPPQAEPRSELPRPTPTPRGGSSPSPTCPPALRCSRSGPGWARSRWRCSTPVTTSWRWSSTTASPTSCAPCSPTKAPPSKARRAGRARRRHDRRPRGAGHAAPAPRACVSNLPYNVAVPVVVRLLEEADTVERILVMVQREVGERLAAGPGDPQYGAVSVKVAYFAEAQVVGLVPPTVFVPRPKVDSALVRLRRRAEPPVSVPSADDAVHAGAGRVRAAAQDAAPVAGPACSVRPPPEVLAAARGGARPPGPRRSGSTSGPRWPASAAAAA